MACQLGNQTHIHPRPSIYIATSSHLDVIDMDVMCMISFSLCGRWYILVLVHDFSRFT